MKKRHLVKTVQDCIPTVNLFFTKKEMNNFIKKFSKKYKSKDGYWIDLVVTDIVGNIIDDGKLL